MAKQIKPPQAPPSIHLSDLCDLQIREDGLLTVVMPDGKPLYRVKGTEIVIEQNPGDLTKVTLTIYCNTVKS